MLQKMLRLMLGIKKILRRLNNMEEAKFVLGLELFFAWIVVACYGLYLVLKILWNRLRGEESI